MHHKLWVSSLRKQRALDLHPIAAQSQLTGNTEKRQ